MKRSIAALALSTILLCGCGTNTEFSGDMPDSSSELVVSVPEESSAESSSESSSESSIASSPESSSESSVVSSFEPVPPYNGLTSIGRVWEYPFGDNLTYDFASGNIIKGLEDFYGLTGAELYFEGEWCAAVLSYLLYEDGYEIEYQYNPCDLTIELLDNGFAHFYCLRQENYDSLVEWGLQSTDRVIMTNHEEFVPKRGDFVCYLWTEEANDYNWSHIGMVAEDYDGTLLRTIEGNIGKGRDPLYHAVEARERNYDSTVIGFIRLDER